MKKLLFTLFLVVSSLLVSAQTYYKAVLTELYTYNLNTESWDLYQKNSDVNITVVVEDEFVNFQALSPSMYRILTSTKQPFNTKNFQGYRYTAKDLKKETYVQLDILGSSTTEYFLISIISEDKQFNSRYFMKKM